MWSLHRLRPVDGNGNGDEAYTAHAFRAGRRVKPLTYIHPFRRTDRWGCWGKTKAQKSSLLPEAGPGHCLPPVTASNTY